MFEHEADMKGLRREWWTARIITVLGGLMLIAVAVLIVTSDSNNPIQPSPAQIEARRHAAAIALCTASVGKAEAFGIVPSYTRLASDVVQPGSVSGRYTCFAQTSSAKYEVTFDLMCTDLNDAKCVNLFSVTQDGTALYQRH